MKIWWQYFGKDFAKIDDGGGVESEACLGLYLYDVRFRGDRRAGGQWNF